MHNWFECKVSYEKMLENGMQKKVTEPYLVDALSFTEAEARIIEEIRPFITGEFTVTDIKRARLSELFFNENGDRFYKIKVYFITLDEKSGAEKKTAAQMLAQATTLKEAIAVLEDGMKGTLADYTIASVTETQLMDVFPFDANSIPGEKKSGEELIAEQKQQAEQEDKNMRIAQNIVQLKTSLPQGVTLVAVSKFHPVEALWEAYNAGQRVFGESRAQELSAKQKVLPEDIEWHFIGPLQSNKVKDIAPFIHLIHSIDSLKLLAEVNKQAKKHDRTIRVLLEIHVAQEESKHGLSPEECKELLRDESLAEFQHIRICGLMGMATNTDDTGLIREEFRNIHDLFIELKETLCKDNVDFKEISMGMSHDYPIAIQEGSSLIRVGTSIFGEREY